MLRRHWSAGSRDPGARLPLAERGHLMGGQVCGQQPRPGRSSGPKHRRVFTVYYIIFLPSTSPQDLCSHTLLLFTILLLPSPDKHHLFSTTAPLFWPSLNSPCEAEQWPVTRGCSVITVQQQMRSLQISGWGNQCINIIYFFCILKTKFHGDKAIYRQNKFHIYLSKFIKRNIYLLFYFYFSTNYD